LAVLKIGGKKVNCRAHCHTRPYIGTHVGRLWRRFPASELGWGRYWAVFKKKNVNKSASERAEQLPYNIVYMLYIIIIIIYSNRPITHVHCSEEEKKFDGARDMCLGSFYLPFERRIRHRRRCRRRRFFFKNCHSV
jgi:hypothetical protein